MSCKTLSFEQLKDHQMVINGNGGAWDRYLRRKLPPGCILAQSDFEDYISLIHSSIPVWAFASDSAVKAHFQPAGYRFVLVSDEDAHLDYWCSCLKEKKKKADLLRSFL